MTEDAYRAVRTRMAELTSTNVEDWHLVTKARQGMQTALASARVALGREEVVTQLFTCVTAINPILAAGLKPTYVDVSQQTLSIDEELAKAGESTCAVVLQHTFGIIDQESSVSLGKLAHGSGAILVEDSAHCVGRMARDAAGEPIADVSVHSFGVEKILPGTYFGGAVWVNPAMKDARVAQAIRVGFESLPAMDGSLERATRKYLNQVRILTRLPHGAAQALRAKWERSGSFEPAVSEQERRGTMNHNPSIPSEWVCEQALAALGGLEANEQQRRSCVDAYIAAFSHTEANDLFVPVAALKAAGQPLLRFPVFEKDELAARAVCDAVGALGLYVPEWPRPLLVPGVLDPAPYGISQGCASWPVSEHLSQTVVALPTDIDPARIPEILSAIAQR